MATESSAVVRFITLSQQQAAHPIEDTTASLPDFTADLKPFGRSLKVPVLVVGTVLFAGVAAAAGVFVGKNYFGGSSDEAPVAAKAVTAPAPAPAPATAMTPVTESTEPAPAEPQPAVVAVPPEVLAETGFDIRVDPPAEVSLDGKTVGRAPLRVRNVTPGTHVVEIEAPAGYFSRRIDLELGAGKPENVHLRLDPIEEHTATALVADDASQKSSGKAEHRESRKSARKKSRRSADRGSDLASAIEPAAIAEERPASSKGDTGTLMLGSKPPCDIYIDGKALGMKTPAREIELAPGSYKVMLVNRDLDIKKQFTVKIAPGKNTRAIHDLTGKI